MKLRMAVLVAGLVVLGITPGIVTAANVVAPQVKFMEFNYCGVNPACPAQGQYNATLANKIKAFHPSVVLIEEICRSQLDALQADLANPSNPWTFQVYQLDVIDYYTECAGAGPNDEFGNAILTQKSATACCTTWILSPGVWKQQLMCLTTTVGGTGALAVPLAVCVTHLRPNHDQACDQEAVATPDAYNYGSGMAIVYGGDFNLTPGDACLNSVYAGRGGHFEELDQALNRSTTDGGTKYDYLFFKQAYAKNPGGVTVSATSASDHHLFYGSMDICSDNVC